MGTEPNRAATYVRENRTEPKPYTQRTGPNENPCSGSCRFGKVVVGLAKEDLDTTGVRGSRVHNRLAVVIGAGSLVVEVATALAGQAQQ